MTDLVTLSHHAKQLSEQLKTLSNQLSALTHEAAIPLLEGPETLLLQLTLFGLAAIVGFGSMGRISPLRHMPVAVLACVIIGVSALLAGVQMVGRKADTVTIMGGGLAVLLLGVGVSYAVGIWIRYVRLGVDLERRRG